MLYEEIVSHEGVFPELDLQRNAVLYEVGLVVAENWRLPCGFYFPLLLSTGGEQPSSETRTQACFHDRSLVVIGVETRPPSLLRPLRGLFGLEDSSLMDIAPYHSDGHPKWSVAFVRFHALSFLSLTYQSNTFSYSINVQTSAKPLLWNVGRFTCRTNSERRVSLATMLKRG